jgi:hypothetical protein
MPAGACSCARAFCHSSLRAWPTVEIVPRYGESAGQLFHQPSMGLTQIVVWDRRKEVVQGVVLQAHRKEHRDRQSVADDRDGVDHLLEEGQRPAVIAITVGDEVATKMVSRKSDQ